MTTPTRNQRKEKSGTVVSTKMDKTAIVRVNRTMRHPLYHKVVTVSKKYYAHNDQFELAVGDEVTIMETRPLSKLKRWRVVSKQEKVSA